MYLNNDTDTCFMRSHSDVYSGHVKDLHARRDWLSWSIIAQQRYMETGYTYPNTYTAKNIDMTDPIPPPIFRIPHIADFKLGTYESVDMWCAKNTPLKHARTYWWCIAHRTSWAVCTITGSVIHNVSDHKYSDILNRYMDQLPVKFRQAVDYAKFLSVSVANDRDNSYWLKSPNEQLLPTSNDIIFDAIKIHYKRIEILKHIQCEHLTPDQRHVYVLLDAFWFSIQMIVILHRVISDLSGPNASETLDTTIKRVIYSHRDPGLISDSTSNNTSFFSYAYINTGDSEPNSRVLAFESRGKTYQEYVPYEIGVNHRTVSTLESDENHVTPTTSTNTTETYSRRSSSRRTNKVNRTARRDTYTQGSDLFVRRTFMGHILGDSEELSGYQNNTQIAGPLHAYVKTASEHSLGQLLKHSNDEYRRTFETTQGMTQSTYDISRFRTLGIDEMGLVRGLDLSYSLFGGLHSGKRSELGLTHTHLSGLGGTLPPFPIDLGCVLRKPDTENARK
jgi:hypothetical protein